MGLWLKKLLKSLKNVESNSISIVRITNINKISVKQGVICNALSYNEVTTAEFFAPRHGIRTGH